jgi:uncharacterized cupredoxin-like copper-binding protein
MRRNRSGSWRALYLSVGLLMLVALVAGCGDDDEEDSADSGSTTEQPAGSLKITASGSEKALEFEAPATVPSGAVNIEFTNNTKDEVDAQLVRIDGEHEDAEVIAQLGGATQGKPVEDWFHAAGGAGEAKPGQTSTVTQVLEPGTYYVVGGEEPPKGPPTKFEVSAGEAAELPQTEAKVIATEYAFTGQNLKPGEKVELRNEGKEWHHFIASQMKPDATIEEVKKFLETEKGEPPFAGEDNEVSSTVMDGGVSQIVDVDLKPGKYAFFCFIADRKGGPPHVQKGMISEVTVSE